VDIADQVRKAEKSSVNCPFSAVWRTGANGCDPSPRFSLRRDVSVKNVPAGQLCASVFYSLVNQIWTIDSFLKNNQTLGSDRVTNEFGLI